MSERRPTWEILQEGLGQPLSYVQRLIADMVDEVERRDREAQRSYKAFLDSAPTRAQRQRRKEATFMLRYGMSGRNFARKASEAVLREIGSAAERVMKVPPRHAMSQHVTTALWGAGYDGKQRLGVLVIDDPWCGLQPDHMPHTAADVDRVIEWQGTIVKGKNS